MAVSLQYRGLTIRVSLQEPIRFLSQVHIDYFMSTTNVIFLDLFARICITYLHSIGSLSNFDLINSDLVNSGCL